MRSEDAAKLEAYNFHDHFLFPIHILWLVRAVFFISARRLGLLMEVVVVKKDYTALEPKSKGGISSVM